MHFIAVRYRNDAVYPVEVEVAQVARSEMKGVYIAPRMPRLFPIRLGMTPSIPKSMGTSGCIGGVGERWRT